MLLTKQFVPQEVCLACDGCCRFKDANSPWRPKVSVDEIYKWRYDNPSLSEKIFSDQRLDGEGYIKTKKVQGQCQCSFFDAKSNTCQVYGNRPFQCQLYPFILTKTDKGFGVSVHLSCPFIQETFGKDTFNDYAAYLKEYFHKEEVLKFLNHNPSLFDDYSAYENELQLLFTVDVKANNAPVGDLLGRRMAVEGYLEKENSRLSTSSLVNIFAWKDFFEYDLKVIDGCLCVFAKDANGGSFLYLPPLGEKITPKAIEESFHHMDAANKSRGVSRIENVAISQLKYFDETKYSFYKKGYEYCYYKKDLVDLKGNPYKSKRALYNQFFKGQKYRLAEYTGGLYDDCVKLYDSWVKKRQKTTDDPVYLQMLEENRKVHQLILKHYREWGLTGRVVFVNDTLKAYSFGFPLRQKIFCILLEVCDLNYKGLPVFIFREFCNDKALQHYQFINVMDDFGLEKIKTTKMSFRPSVLLPMYSVTRKNK